jgi:hypothetical protein
VTTFQELDEYLKQNFSDDYWSDDAKFYACDLVQKMQPADWDILLSIWQTRSQQWQIRCAEILDWADASQAIPLLLEMIQMPDDELTLTAADSLNSLDLAKGNWFVKQEVFDRLQAISQKGSIAQIVANKLLQQL